jgi:acyl transferase domain-containing protein
MNNDGRAIGPMTPRPEGQRAVLELAYRDAGVAPDSVGYLEAHGTATRVGDEVEIRALKGFRASRQSEPGRCAISSVKANIGHTLAAAGIAGLVKAVLVLNESIIPPQPDFAEPRRSLELEDRGLWVPTEEHAWPTGQPRRAAVSSFGFGGTNVHVILDGPHPLAFEEEGRAEPFLISAPNPGLLADYLGQLEEAVRQPGKQPRLVDLAWTLSVLRRRDTSRVSFLARDHDELRARLAAARAAVVGAGPAEDVFIHLAARQQDAPPDLTSLEEQCKRSVWEKVDFEPGFAGRGARAAFLPPSPLEMRPFWPVARKASRKPLPLPPLQRPALTVPALLQPQ